MPKVKLNPPNEYSSTELAAYLGVSREAIQQWRRQGRIPEPAQRRGWKRIWSQAEADEIKGMIKD